MGLVKLKKRHIRLIISLIILALGGVGVLTTAPVKEQVTQVASQQNPGLYQVDHAADGDTIVVKNGDKKETVRLIGVDTPEKNDRRKPVQCFAKAASEFTKSRVEGREVRLEADTQSDNRDRYGRMLRYVYLPDGTLLNKAIISEGYGFAMTGFLHTKMEEFKTAGQDAREHNKGLWNACTISTTTGYPQTNAAN